MNNNPDYCPLCGAHEYEMGQGSNDDVGILREKDSIIELYNKLQELLKAQ